MNLNKQKFSIKTPALMGVCNVTTDSFSDGGKNYKINDALESIKKMYKLGAQIIDIGAESARPGSDPISYKKEIKKIEPILKQIPKNKFIISIDSNKIETQEFALKNGAHIINDIYGGSEDLFLLSKKYNNGLVLMHTPAPPKIMQTKVNDYTDILKDIRSYFNKKIKILNKYNISSSKVWLDPGIGFGKNLKQNLKIMKNLKKLKIKVLGPISPDSSFLVSKKYKFDVIVGMYHDQVLTPFKTIYNFKAINVTLGLPYIRVSPDHGVAEDIAGKNVANPLSLIESIKFFNFIK